MSDPAATRGPAVCPRCGARYDPGSTFCPVDGTRLEPLGPPTGAVFGPGSILADRYRLVRLLGEGGMGHVYEAEHLHIQKRFAVKLLRREIAAQTDALRRFQREARSASAIGHDSIVEIEDFATLPDGTVYLAMEYLEGQTLATRLRTPPLPAIDELVTLFRPVCRGLGAAHAHGIVHRDVKPENIFLQARRGGAQQVKILDFGIAKISHGDDVGLTRTGAIFGTPRYMSPEQAAGLPVDHRADVYALGAILFEVLTGRPPFEGDTLLAMLNHHAHTPPPRPREVAPARYISPALEALVLSALAKQPAARPQTMEAFEQALVAAVAEAPTVERPAHGAATAGSHPAPATALGAAPSWPAGAIPSPTAPPTIAPAPPSPPRRRMLAVLVAAALFAICSKRRSPDTPAASTPTAGGQPTVSVQLTVPPGTSVPAGDAEDEDDDGDDDRPRGPREPRPAKIATRQAPASPSAPGLVTSPATPAPAPFTGLFRSEGTLVQLVQNGARVHGMALSQGTLIRVRGAVRGDRLVGQAIASGLAPVPFRARLRGDQLAVHFTDGQSAHLARIPTGSATPWGALEGAGDEE